MDYDNNITEERKRLAAKARINAVEYWSKKERFNERNIKYFKELKLSDTI